MANEGKDVSKHITSVVQFLVKPTVSVKLLANSVFLQCYSLTHPDAFMIFNKLNKVLCEQP